MRQLEAIGYFRSSFTYKPWLKLHSDPDVLADGLKATDHIELTFLKDLCFQGLGARASL
jgi:hypothetical protein